MQPLKGKKSNDERKFTPGDINQMWRYGGRCATGNITDQDAVEEFQNAYLPLQADNLYSTRLQIKETEFTERLLYVNSWEEARSKTSLTSLKDRSLAANQKSDAYGGLRLR